MRNTYRHLMLATGFALLVGCQTQSGSNLFMMHPSDASITTSVQQSMMHDPNLSHTRIHVETMNGNVMLSGHVRTIRQSDTAEAIAKSTSGVQNVKNNIVVRK